jgi:hypothetical protein
MLFPETAPTTLSVGVNAVSHAMNHLRPSNVAGRALQDMACRSIPFQQQVKVETTEDSVQVAVRDIFSFFSSLDGGGRGKRC